MHQSTVIEFLRGKRIQQKIKEQRNAEIGMLTLGSSSVSRTELNVEFGFMSKLLFFYQVNKIYPIKLKKSTSIHFIHLSITSLVLYIKNGLLYFTLLLGLHRNIFFFGVLKKKSIIHPMFPVLSSFAKSIAPLYNERMLTLQTMLSFRSNYKEKDSPLSTGTL